MTKQRKTALVSAGILGGSLLVAFLVLVLGAKREDLRQTLEVSYSHELSNGRYLVRPREIEPPDKTLAVAKVTRYPFGFAVVETAKGASDLPRQPVPVSTRQLAPGPVQRTVLAFGTVAAEHDAQVVAETEGVVTRVAVSLGASLPSDTTLIELDPRDHELALARAQAQLEFAEGAQIRGRNQTKNLLAQLMIAQQSLAARSRERERWQQLAAKEMASQDRSDQAELAWRAASTLHAQAKAAYESALLGAKETDSNVALARTQHDQAALGLARCRVRAPFEGDVAERYVDVGDFVRRGTPVVRLVASSTVRLRAHVRAEDALAIPVGANVEITVPGVAFPTQVKPGAGGTYAREGTSFVGQIEGVSASADPATRKFAVDVTVANPQRLLRDGMFARAVIDAGILEGSYLVPDEAVAADEQGHFVYVVEGDLARRRDVVLGARQGEGRILRSGLEGTVELVVAGSALLFDGAPIRRLGD